MACPRKTEVAQFHFVDATRAAIQAHLAQMREAARSLQALPALDERGCDQSQLVLDFFNTRWRDHHQDKERYDGLRIFCRAPTPPSLLKRVGCSRIMGGSTPTGTKSRRCPRAQSPIVSVLSLVRWHMPLTCLCRCMVSTCCARRRCSARKPKPPSRLESSRRQDASRRAALAARRVVGLQRSP